MPIVVGLLIALALGLLTLPLTGFMVMLGIGILHTYFPELPAFGYGSSIMIALALRLIFPLSTSGSSSD